MGERGPVARAGSVRALRAEKRAAKSAKLADLNGRAEPKALAFPSWMPRTAATTWRRIVGGLAKAGVNLQQIDGEAVGFYTLCVDGAAAAAAKDDAKLTARFARDAIAWGNLIGASPSSRARLGIAPKKAEEHDAWDDLADGLPLTGNRELDRILRRPRPPKVPTQAEPPKAATDLSARRASARVGVRR